MILAGTGHRPPKLRGYDARRWGSTSRLFNFARHVLRSQAPTPSVVISGMAQGWDAALAEAAIQEGIPLLAAIPFLGQEGRWPRIAQEEYQAVLARAAHVEVIGDEPSTETFHARNRWMVDNCQRLLVLWDGAPSGGTAACVRYARQTGREVVPLWDAWTRWTARVPWKGDR